MGSAGFGWRDRCTSGSGGTHYGWRLAEYKPRFTPLGPDDAAVQAQLRFAIGSSDPEQVRAAASGLTQTATAEDVQSIVAAAARLPDVAVWLSSDPGDSCPRCD